jgi:septum site-determining protein MinD
MSETSRAGQAYRNIARRLLGEEVPFMQLAEVKQGGIFAKIKKMFGG